MKARLRNGRAGAFLHGAGAAPKKRRRAQRKRVRLVEQACSDAVEETISSTDGAVAQRKRARFHKAYTP